MDVELQAAIRARLVASSSVLAIVPASSILDRNASPAPRPGIVLGETQLIDEGQSIGRNLTRIYHTIHVWIEEPSRVIAKRACAAVRAALSRRLVIGMQYHVVDSRVSTVRVMSDPDGKTSHGVVTFQALVEEL